ncbi:MAG: type II toxin-antitoxin system RelE/ParE family toxin, partial [Kiritimatiellae bacterium]|nr:type II toxin-antitoxin system RelE/ParE family toxin [Kiritimatiellia bacterium]
RMFFGPGYRAYFGKDGDKLILLLCGGDKKTQKRDIKEAKMLWNEYQKRKGE